MRIVRSTDYRRMKWKNGGGETIEIAVSPEGAPIDAFDWRISMAHVATPGPFSIFADVDRTLAVIDGAGVILHLSGRGAVRLAPGAAPFAFPGDVPVDAALVDGPIDDLNVMTRRGRYRHLLSRLRLREPTALPCHGDTVIVVAMRRGARVGAGSRKEILGAGDAVILDRGDGGELGIIPDGEAEFLVIDLWRCAAAACAKGSP
jgi:uncharacterized protein